MHLLKHLLVTALFMLPLTLHAPALSGLLQTTYYKTGKPRSVVRIV